MERFNLFLTHVNDQLVNPLIKLLFALAVAFFLYGVFEFMMNQDNEKEKTAGKQHMFWGVIGIAIMLGVWGILNIIISTFNIDKDLDIKSTDNQGEVNVHLRDYNPPYPKVGQ